MKNKRLFKASLGIFSLMLVSLGVALSSLWKGESSNSKLFGVQKNSAVSLQESIDPDDYVEIDGASFGAYIRDYTGTSLSRHMNVQFESKAITTFKSSRQDIYSVIDDDNYSGDISNPFIADTGSNKLNGYIYRAEYKAKSGEATPSIIMHDSITYGTKIEIVNTRIAAECMTEASQYGAAVEIYICENIDVIDSGAFQHVPDTVTFKCLAPSKPAGWAADWTDADDSRIKWGQSLVKPTDKTAKSTGTKVFGVAKDYILGYHGSLGQENIASYPLTISFQKQDANGNITTEFIEIPKKHKTNMYDAVGSTIFGNTNSFQISIDLHKGETLIEGSFEFYNIFNAIKKELTTVTAWPESAINYVVSTYGIEESLYPVQEGENFATQTFETSLEQYVNVFSKEESAAKAEEVLNSYVAKLEAMKDEEENPLFVKYDHLPEISYGLVYEREYVAEDGEHYGAFVQLYTYENYFVSYFALNHLKHVEENDSYVVDGALPFANKAKPSNPYTWIPDLSAGKFKSKTVDRYSSMIDIADIFNLEYAGASSFLGYTSIAMQASKKLTTAYAGTLKSDVNNKTLAFLKMDENTYSNGRAQYTADQINFLGTFAAPAPYIADDSSRSKAETSIQTLLDGTLSFRYVLSDLNNASLVITYLKDGQEKEVISKIKSPSPIVEIASSSEKLSFLVNADVIENVKPDNILALGITGVTVNVHLYNTETKTVVQNTQYLKLFGNIEVLPYSGKALTYFNIDLYIILFTLGATVLYVAGAVILFFIKKNKYKNDEFRRMRPKEYIKTSIFVYIGLVLVTLGINFIVMRFGVFNSAIPVFNPIDPFVIGFGLAAAISIGLFIRMIVIMVKAENKRKETERLALDKDVVDDGTH